MTQEILLYLVQQGHKQDLKEFRNFVFWFKTVIALLLDLCQQIVFSDVESSWFGKFRMMVEPQCRCLPRVNVGIFRETHC